MSKMTSAEKRDAVKFVALQRTKGVLAGLKAIEEPTSTAGRVAQILKTSGEQLIAAAEMIEQETGS